MFQYDHGASKRHKCPTIACINHISIVQIDLSVFLCCSSTYAAPHKPSAHAAMLSLPLHQKRGTEFCYLEAGLGSRKMSSSDGNAPSGKNLLMSVKRA